WPATGEGKGPSEREGDSSVAPRREVLRIPRPEASLLLLVRKEVRGVEGRGSQRVWVDCLPVLQSLQVHPGGQGGFGGVQPPQDLRRLGNREGRSLTSESHDPSRIAVAIISGGLDSSTVLYKLRSEGEEVRALTFLYGQRHER